jgi:hypothetical protein
VLVSHKEFSLLVGVSRPAISKAAKDGRLRDAVVVDNGRPMLNREQALQLWERGNVRKARSGSEPVAVVKREEVAAAVAAKVMALPDDEIPGLGISIERKEHYRAEVAKVQAMREREEVGLISEFERTAFAVGKAVREGVLGIVPRVSADLAAIGDVFEIERRLEAELITALRVLADG